MDAQTRDRYLRAMGLLDPPRVEVRAFRLRVAALGVVERKFNPGQKRDPHTGKWVDVPGSTAVANALDKLKLAGRIELDDGEELVSSGKLDLDSAAVRVAVTRRGGEVSMRFAAEYSQEGRPKWDGGQSTADADRRRLSDEMDQLDEDDPGYEALAEQLGELGEVDWATARLDAPAIARLRSVLQDAVVEGARLEKESNANWDEIEELDSKPWGELSEADKARRLHLYEIETARGGDLGYVVIAEGTIPGEWGDVVYDVTMDESRVTAQVRVRPHGAGDDWGLDDPPEFDLVELRKLLKLLGSA